MKSQAIQFLCVVFAFIGSAMTRSVPGSEGFTSPVETLLQRVKRGLDDMPKCPINHLYLLDHARKLNKIATELPTEKDLTLNYLIYNGRFLSLKCTSIEETIVQSVCAAFRGFHDKADRMRYIYHAEHIRQRVEVTIQEINLLTRSRRKAVHKHQQAYQKGREMEYNKYAVKCPSVRLDRDVSLTTYTRSLIAIFKECKPCNS